MGLSQILLTGFVVYWLIGQYKSEKENLHQQLNYEFLEAQNQAMDSTLYVFLRPLLKDSLNFKDSLSASEWVSSTTDSIDTVYLGAKYTTDGPASGHIIQIGISDTGYLPVTGKASYQISTIPHQDALLHGVKMIFQMSADSTGVGGVEGQSPFPEVDSVLLLSLASKRLLDMNHSDFKIFWYQDSLNFNSPEYKKRIRFQSDLSRPKMIYEVANFEPFLLREMIPQILFALFLLLLTASAFILTFKSLRRQVLLNTLRNEFISNVSHELKTPVSTVKVALESLQNYDLKKDAAVSDEYLKIASLEMDRLDFLIQKILNQSLLESQKVVINQESSDLVNLTKNVIQSVKPRIQELNGSIELIGEVDELLVSMDDLYIQGVLINLLDNAIKYGGDPPIIQVNIRKKNGGTFLSVLDNGEGISKEYHEKVFERFFRVPTGDRHNVKGYGLGLSFAAQVMQQHGGSIKVENGSSGGCLFTIFFKK